MLALHSVFDNIEPGAQRQAFAGQKDFYNIDRTTRDIEK
jgi:hypothetical protein